MKENQSNTKSSAKTVLKTENLSIGYSSKKSQKIIAENIALNIIEGIFIGLVGINGSGKSTLLRSLTGLQELLSGSIYLEDENIKMLSSEILSKKISVVLTGQAISKNLSVSELVALGRQPYTNWLGKFTQEDIEIVINALKATELYELKNEKCHTLSDGQLQRVLIARALAQDTDIIILDEPTTHLDLHHKASILTLLKEICKTTKKTILFSTHDIELVLPLCDQIIVMHKKQALMDTPGNLISKGIFETLFPEDIIGFDALSKRFFLKNKN